MQPHSSTFTQAAFQYRKLGYLLSQAAIASKVDAERADAMADALMRELGDAIEFTQPAGGMFFWARLTGASGKVKDASEFAKRAIEQGVAFVPGAPFYAADADLATLRVSFATADGEKILEGELLGLAQCLKFFANQRTKNAKRPNYPY